MFKKGLSNFTLIFIIIIGILSGISYGLYNYIKDIHNKEIERVELKKKLLKANSKFEKSETTKEKEDVEELVDLKMNELNANIKINNKKENKKSKKNKKIKTEKKDVEKTFKKKLNISFKKKNKLFLNGNICFFGIKNFKFVSFISHFDYKNDYLINRIRYNKEYKKYLKEYKINYVCFHKLDLNKIKIKKILKKIDDNKLEAKEKNTYLSYFLRKNSSSIIKGTIYKDVSLGKINKIDGCTFKNFNKLLLEAGIILSDDELNDVLLNNCYVNEKFKIYKLVKNTDTNKIYKRIFVSKRNFYKNKKGTYFDKHKYYYNALNDFVEYLLNKKSFGLEKNVNINIIEIDLKNYFLKYLNYLLNI